MVTCGNILIPRHAEFLFTATPTFALSEIGTLVQYDCEAGQTCNADPKGDRVALGMTGKFLPFKYYGAKGNELAVGLKEE